MIITDQAFLRADGRKGIRNHIVVAYLVECAHHVAREIVYPYRERGVHLIGFGGCYPNDYAARMMRTLCTHPNVGGVILLSLGCESFNRNSLREAIVASGRPEAAMASRRELRLKLSQPSDSRITPPTFGCVQSVRIMRAA